MNPTVPLLAQERVTEIDFAGAWVRCYLDEKGALIRVTTTNRFWVELRDPKRDKQGLAAALEELGMPAEEAKNLAEAQGEMIFATDRERMDFLSGYSRLEAEQVLKVLRRQRVKCRIMPWLIAKEGDTW